MPIAPVHDSDLEPAAQGFPDARVSGMASDVGQISPVGQPDAAFNRSLGAGRNLRRGALLAGKYVVEDVLGSGAMGVVVSARHLVLNERVAIKSLRPEVLDNPEAVARFMREARAAVRIKSEHVARVTDVGTFEDGAPFMVMEYLDGEDLSSWLRTHGPLPLAQAVEFVLEACEAIAEAHVLGIIHRDLKPANLFCIRRRDGSLAIKVLDFGISKVTDIRYSSSALSMTDASALMGSPNYMSPEQLQQPRDIDPRTDIWSLGVILFELLAGSSPFTGESLPELIINITTQPPKSVRSIRPELPAKIESVIMQCLRKDRSERYAHIGELACALGPLGPKRSEAYVDRITGILQSAGVASGVSGPITLRPGPDSSTRSEEQTKITWGHTTPPALHSRRKILMGSFGVVAALGIALLAWAKTNDGTNEQTLSSTNIPPLTQPATSAPLTPVHAPSPLSAVVAIPHGEDAPSTNPVTPGDLPRVEEPSGRADKVTNSRANHVVSKLKLATRVAPAPTSRLALPVNARPTSTSPAASPHAACDPPYTLDALGRKHFKPECYLNRGQ